MTVLLIKHLPSVLCDDDYCDLLKQFGAVKVKCCGTKGPLKYSAYAQFPTDAKAKYALTELHQLELLGKRLCVQYASNQAVFEGSSTKGDLLSTTVTVKSDQAENKTKQPAILEVSDDINSLSEKWRVTYSFDPKLRYSYPAPNVRILTNITNALASVPKFYVQVLHLMNRMNLPAPFGALTATPPLPEPLTVEPEIEEAEMAISSSEESELESDERDSITQADKDKVTKREQKKAKRLNRKRVRPVFNAPTLQPVTKSDVNIGEIFEQPASKVAKRIEIIQVTPQEAPPRDISQAADSDMFASYVTADVGVDSNSVMPSEVSGFGKIEPPPKVDVDDHNDTIDEDDDDTEFISSRRLRRGRISSKEMHELSAFRRYEAGEPSSRLYIKNIAKQTTERDLRYIFGRYVDWENDMEKNMFDIRLMKEGRMKGQAFVSLASTEKAQAALKDTHGFELNDKPMVVSFARSSKPKEADTKADGKTKK